MVPPNTNPPATETFGVRQIVLKVLTLFRGAVSYRGAELIVKVAGAAIGQLTGSGTAWDLARTIEAEKVWFNCQRNRKGNKMT